MGGKETAMKSTSKMFKALFGGGILLLVFALVGQAAAQICVEPPAGLVSWWPGDGNVDDIVDGNDGTLQNGATFAAGKVEQAFSFATVGDMVQIAHNSNLNLESLLGSTFEGWFKSSGGDGVVIAKHTCGAAGGWFFTTCEQQ